MYNMGMKIKCLLFAALTACLAAGPAAWAQSPDLTNEDRDMVRVVRRPDGTRTVYKRQAGMRGMWCGTYLPDGNLAVIHDYVEGPYGQLVACVVYDSMRTPIYKVAYGYDNQARLIEERMFSYPERKLVQRVIYRYDSSGNRSKPLIISLDTAMKKIITPTMSEDVANAHQRLRQRNNNKRRR